MQTRPSLATALQQAMARQRAASARHDVNEVARCKTKVAELRARIAAR